MIVLKMLLRLLLLIGSITILPIIVLWVITGLSPFDALNISNTKENDTNKLQRKRRTLG
jgi:hypothetical protein